MLLRLSSLLTICLLAFSACNKEQKSEATAQASADSLSSLQVSSLPAQRIRLTDLGAFKPVKANNWFVAGNVYADRHTNQHLEITKGSGILVNLPGKNNTESANLFTSLEHGDMDLELEFLMPKGANSGVYLQGRYEVQLLDSWLKDSLSYGELGGIYKGVGNNFKGKAPDKNAAKAPGLWQHLKLRFIAPQFDESGKKITNARFEEVYLNGVLVQEQIEVSEPTLAAAFEDEKPVGPLMLQGDHGPVAFRDIRYKTYADDRIELQQMQYYVYEGMYKASIDSIPGLKPTHMGSTDTLSQKFSKEDDLFVVEGAMFAPREGDYIFELKAGGPAWLYINDEMVTDNKGTRNYEQGFYGRHTLQKDTNKFRLIYSNYDESLSLHYEGPGIPWTKLSTPASERHYLVIEKLPYEAKDRTLMQRGFMMHQGVKVPYAIAVGTPEGMNYAYNLDNFSLLSVWHGDFLDVGEMWIERGESQLAKPMGAALELSGKPTVARLEESGNVWPDSFGERDSGLLRERGYRVQANGSPLYYYQMENVQVEDLLYASADYSALVREVKIQADGADENLYVMLGSGVSIEHLPNGSYAINDKSYYIEHIKAGSAQPLLRKHQGEYELLLPVDVANNTISYSIIW